MSSFLFKNFTWSVHRFDWLILFRCFIFNVDALRIVLLTCNSGNFVEIYFKLDYTRITVMGFKERVCFLCSIMTKLPENRQSTIRRLRYSEAGSRGVSKRENKAAQTLTIVVGGFIACWLLFFMAYISGPFLPKDSISATVMNLLTWLGTHSETQTVISGFLPDFTWP